MSHRYLLWFSYSALLMVNLVVVNLFRFTIQKFFARIQRNASTLYFMAGGFGVVSRPLPTRS